LPYNPYCKKRTLVIKLRNSSVLYLYALLMILSWKKQYDLRNDFLELLFWWRSL